MKALLRILVLLALLLVLFFYINQDDEQPDLIKGPDKTVPKTEAPTMNGNMTDRPKEGWSTYVGKPVEKIVKKLGEPVRKGPSAYGFEWWVYKDEGQYMLVGVSKKKINQVYMTGSSVDAKPFKMGQSIDELYRNTITDTEINIKIDSSIYTLILSETDLQSRLLVLYDGVIAQLYFDHTTKKLTAVRFIDGETLVKQQPYDMTYVGTMIQAKKPSSFQQVKINDENAMQLFELTNFYRKDNDLKEFTNNEQLNTITSDRLRNIVMERISKSDSMEMDLKTLLKENNIDFEDVSENMAEHYSDAADAMNGFVNSEKHRKDMLNEKFTSIGTSAFEKNYSQIFIEENLKKMP